MASADVCASSCDCKAQGGEIERETKREKESEREKKRESERGSCQWSQGTCTSLLLLIPKQSPAQSGPGPSRLGADNGHLGVDSSAPGQLRGEQEEKGEKRASAPFIIHQAGARRVCGAAQAADKHQHKQRGS